MFFSIACKICTGIFLLNADNIKSLYIFISLPIFTIISSLNKSLLKLYISSIDNFSILDKSVVKYKSSNDFKQTL